MNFRNISLVFLAIAGFAAILALRRSLFQPSQPSDQTISATIVDTKPLTSGVLQNQNNAVKSRDESSTPAEARERMGRPVTDEMRYLEPTKKDLVSGAGKMVVEGSNISFHIVMKLMDGKVVFDSRKDGRPWKGAIGDGTVLLGLDRTMRGMFVGGRRAIWLPPHLAYGEYGISPQVPPNSKVYAEVELLSVF
ncbi:MAG: FKBP-type peptidyl-prolyl cis-trans isomerase [Proteobacteria bacterium]|nr:FKBP-type peptidyl-prolyl cis-trans isomerase [Pseudomonadota bacterium]